MSSAVYDLEMTIESLGLRVLSLFLGCKFEGLGTIDIVTSKDSLVLQLGIKRSCLFFADRVFQLT